MAATIKKTEGGLVVPLVHLNGTGRTLLSEQYSTAADALYKAQMALQQCAPHMRDFYPYGSDDAYREARAQHEARFATLEGLIAQLADLHAAVNEGG